MVQTRNPASRPKARVSFAVYGHVGRRFDELLLTPTLEIGGVYASGDDRGSVYKQFDPILPDPFTYGAFDVFGLSNHMGGNARLTVVPWTDATIGVDYRYARLARGEGEWIGCETAPQGHGLVGCLHRRRKVPGGCERIGVAAERVRKLSPVPRYVARQRDQFRCGVAGFLEPARQGVPG